MAAAVVAVETFSCDADGREGMLTRAGDELDGNDPVVKAHPEKFTPAEPEPPKRSRRAARAAQ